MKSKNLLSVADLSSEEISSVISRSLELKSKNSDFILKDKVLVILSEKPSLRTRVSFELAMRQLGGYSIYLSPEEVGLGRRESPEDIARVLSNYANGIAARTFSHHTLEVMAGCASIPVINALSDQEHPCQALADLLTIQEIKGKLKGLTIAYVGDSNNVANSLLLAAVLSGINFRIASPDGYQLQPDILNLAQKYASASGAEIFCTQDPRLAVKGSDVVYTDVWASMGQETEAEKRRSLFANYQITNDLLDKANKDAILMHPLPAHHGEEVARDVLYCSRSVVFHQAENRLHLQKAILANIMGGSEK